MEKKSYPQGNQYHKLMFVPDTNKWLSTLKQIYFQEQNGVPRLNALNVITKDWTFDEKQNFIDWVKYYEEGNHLKYKKAQNMLSGNNSSYFLPFNKKETSPSFGAEIDYSKKIINQELPLHEKKRIIENQRRKIIGRLDSAEKLLRTSDGELFADTELENLIEAIYSLKKKVQLINKISLSHKTYEDILIRESNVLVSKGFNKAASVISSIAQALAPAPSNNLEGAGDATGITPALTNELDAFPIGEVPNQGNIQETAIKSFIKNINSEGFENDDVNLSDDLIVNDEEELSTFAQVQSTPVATPNTPPAPAAQTKPIDVAQENKNLETNLENAKNTQKSLSNFDDKLDEVFSDITVEDVIEKLDEIANIFRTREVPRQLSIVDIMLDSLGLASLFTNLSEAVNKSLESNNYCLTRIEDISAKLKGSISSSTIDLTNPGSSDDPNVNAVKNKLVNEQQKEKDRKERRRQKEMMEEDKEVPVVEIEEPEEQQPAKVAPPVPTPQG